LALAVLTSLNHDYSLCDPSSETPKLVVLEIIKEILIPRRCLAKWLRLAGSKCK